MSSHGKVVEANTLRLGEPDEDGAKSIRVFAAGLAVNHTDECFTYERPNDERPGVLCGA